MACAIIANAMVFHQRIYGMHEGVNQLQRSVVVTLQVQSPKTRRWQLD